MLDTLNLHLRETSEALEKVNLSRMDEFIKLLKRARERRFTVFTFGNGGSAATASHFSNDLTKMCGIPSVCISDLTPTTLAYGNDLGWQDMFSRPMAMLMKKNDIIVGFSCSGWSMNVLRCLSMIVKNKKVLFTGIGGGGAEKYADFIFYVPSDHITVQEDVHLALCHAIARELSNG